MRSFTLRHLTASSSPKSSALAPRYADIVAPSRVLTTLRGVHVQQRLSLLTLLFMLSAQCLMPGLWTLSEANAAEAQQVTQKQAARKRVVQEAEARSKAPAPAWYREARQKEQANTKAMRLAQVPDVGKFVLEAAKAQPLPGSVAKKVSGAALAAPVRLARLMDGRPRAAKTGQITPSAPLYVPNPLTSTKRIVEVGERVPDQSEISQAGQMCGALAPAAPAQPTEFAAQLDKELRQAGLPAGLKTVAAANTPPGILVAKQKERLKHAQEMNRDFARIINHWNDRNFKLAVKELRDYADQYPKSPWTPEALIHLADNAKFQGQPTEAKTLYEQILAQTSAAPGQMSFEAHQKAYERLADLYIIQGKISQAEPMLSDILHKDLHWRRRTWASYWLQALETVRSSRVSRLALRDCGTKALAAMMDELGRPADARQLANVKPVRDSGFSLAQLQALSARHGVPMRGFRAHAAQLAQLPLPLVLHYGAVSDDVSQHSARTTKSVRSAASNGHFLVAQSVDAARREVKLFDPQNGGRYTLSFSDLDREWSGHGLMPLQKGQRTANTSGTAKIQGVQWLTQREMQRVLGACFVVSAQTGIGDHPNDQTEVWNCPLGAPVVAVNRVSENIFITDTPLWYHPAVGPNVELTISYNSQDASNYNTCFGNKWSFNYGSSIMEDSSGRATVFMPDGRQDIYLPDGNGGLRTPDGIFNTLVKTGTLAYELRFQDGGKAIYGVPTGSNGQQPFLLELRDAWGQSVHIGYDVSIHPVTITDATNQVTTLEWQSGSYGSRIVRVTDPFERQAQFSYDANGNLVECIDMEGNAFQYTYDALVNLTQLNTAQGPWTFQFKDIGVYGTPDFDKKSLTIYDPTQNLPETFAYNGSHNASQRYSYKDHRGNVTIYDAQSVRSALYGDSNSSNSQSYGGDSRITAAYLPGGDSVQWVYDAPSDYYGSSSGPYTLKPTYIMATGQPTTSLTYNAQGRLTQVAVGGDYSSGGTYNSGGEKTTLAYANNGLDVTGITNALNQSTFSASYNAQHQPLSVTDANNHTRTYSYTTWGAPATATDSQGTTTYNYNAQTYRLNSLARGSSTLASYTYDGIGRVITSTDAANLTLSYAYNNLDKMTRVTYPDGTYSSVDYVCCGLPGEVRDRSGRKTYTDYDALKRVARTQDSLGRVINYDYDIDSNLVKLNDSWSHPTHWNYDARNRVTRKTYADGSYEGYNYQYGHLQSRRDARNRVTAYSYDDYGRLSTIDYPTTPDVSLTYDDLNRPLTMTDGLGTTTYAYDAAGQMGALSSVDGPFANDTVSYHYDSLNRRDGMAINGSNATSYGYDALDRLQSLSSPAGSFTYSYWGATGMVAGLQNPNGTHSAYAYDGLERLSDVQTLVDASSSNLSHYSYTHDNVTNRPNRTSETAQVLADPTEVRNYGYDDVDELTGEAVTVGGQAQSSSVFGYDPMGNRTQVTSTSPTTSATTTYTTNKLNQITGLTLNTGQTSTASTCSYDAEGNLTQIANPQSSTQYAYDDADRLSSVIVPNASKSEFLYDGSSRLRVSKEFNWQNGAWVQTGEVRRVYDGMNVVQERDGQNNLICTYTRSGNIGGILARTDGNGSLFYHYDGRGNVAQLSDGTAQIVARYSYDAFGNTTASGTAASLNRYRFSTKEQLAGLYSYGYRFYSSSLGRWINRDPIRERGGVNLYEFFKNNLVNWADTNGLSPNRIGIPISGSGSSDDIYYGPDPGGGGRGGGKDWRHVPEDDGSDPSTYPDSYEEGWAPTGTRPGGARGGRGPITNQEQATDQYVGVGNAQQSSWKSGTDRVHNTEGSEQREQYFLNHHVPEEPVDEEGFPDEGNGGGRSGGGIPNDVGAPGSYGSGNGWDSSYNDCPMDFFEPGCFIVGTLVLMADNTLKPIEKIEKGDFVMSRDEHTGETKPKQVFSTPVRTVSGTTTVQLSTGEVIKTTNEHPFYIQGKGFVLAGRLKAGMMCVTNSSDNVQITKIEDNIDEAHLVYNLGIMDFHTYFVGNSSIWVHNGPAEKTVD